MKTILCYGDSNTWGYCGLSGVRFSYEVRWTGRLARLLPKQYRVVEEGLCGRTTTYELPLEPGRNGYLSLPTTLSSTDPIDLIILMLGTNDRRKQLIVTPQESALAIERYIQLIRTPEHWQGHVVPKILLVSPPEIAAGVLQTDEGFYYDEDSIRHSRELKYAYRKVAKQYGCAFLDAAAHCSPGEDCVHLAPEGHARLTSAMANAVKQILP